jgi:threonyl-tRNA synthetase
MSPVSPIEERRHTLAHLLAAAVAQLHPRALPTIGPAIDTGFYYDFDYRAASPQEEELIKLEEKMRELLPSWTEWSHETVSADQAREKFAGNVYKLELIEEIEQAGETITLYTCGGFTDLCRGGHAQNPAAEIEPTSFKLERIAGAYWRGSEDNAMLSRIYGLAFDSNKELEAYEQMQEEARKRDHRVLGAQLKLFTISPLVGSGLPLLQPNGAIIRHGVESYLWDLHKHKGYHRVWTPHLAKEALYQTSGHAEKFGDELFRVSGKDEKFFMKPMNCPHHMQIFADNHFSYREMPIRYFEPATVYRDEKTGQLSGLTRVRSITQDDGHLFCRIGQISQEVSTIAAIIKEFYSTMGMLEGYWVRLSLRGKDGVYLGSDEVWEEAQMALESAARTNDLPYRAVEGEAAFYGPKLDFMFKDAIGREWQLATIQCDFNMPERFDLFYINEKGEKERPVVIHRAISGSLERFMGVMIEHFAGAFPTWLAPEQVRVLPIAEPHHEYAHFVVTELKAAGIRATLDTSNETLGKKIRAAKTMKVPYQLVIGDAEVQQNSATLEGRAGKLGAMPIADIVAKISEEISTRSL